MTSTQITEQRVEHYLDRLKVCLRGVEPLEKEDILREIRAHILDATASASDRDGAINRVLRLLGTPEELADRYSTESLLIRASHSFSPWVLLRTSWHWAKLGMKGVIAFLLALFGYGTALGMTTAVFLKPFMPSKIGMWFGSEGLNIGVTDHPERMHELLGHWFVPVIAVAAFAIAIGTTQALRWMMRKRDSSAAHLVSGTTLSAQV